MRLRPWALGALACACSGAQAGAQQAGPTAPALGAGRQFDINAGVTTQYDSNFAHTSAALAQQRGVSQEEVTVRPKVDVSIVQPFGNQMVFVEGGGGYDFHRNNTRLDRWAADIQGGYLARLGMCQATSTLAYRAAQSDLATLETVATKNLQQINTVGAGISCGRSRLSGGVFVQRRETKNSAAIEKTGDNDLRSLSAQVGYGTPQFGQVGFVFSYADTSFPNRIIPGRPIGDGFYAETYGLSAGRQFGSRLNVSATVGRTHVKREFAPPGVSQSLNATTYSGSAGYQFGSRLKLDALVARSVQPAALAGKVYDVNTTGNVEGTYKLGSRYQVQLGERITDTKSNVDTSLPLRVVTNGRTNATYAAIRYKQSRRLSFSLNVQHDRRRTNLPEFNYNSTRVSLSAQAHF